MSDTDSIYGEGLPLAALLDRYPDPGAVLNGDVIYDLAGTASHLWAVSNRSAVLEAIGRYLADVAAAETGLAMFGPGDTSTARGWVPGWEVALAVAAIQLATERWKLELVDSPALRWRFLGALGGEVRAEMERSAELHRMPYKATLVRFDDYRCAVTGAERSGLAVVIEPSADWVADEMKDLPPIRISLGAIRDLVGQ